MSYHETIIPSALISSSINVASEVLFRNAYVNNNQAYGGGLEISSQFIICSSNRPGHITLKHTSMTYSASSSRAIMAFFIAYVNIISNQAYQYLSKRLFSMMMAGSWRAS